jgi:hypothetical protein
MASPDRVRGKRRSTAYDKHEQERVEQGEHGEASSLRVSAVSAGDSAGDSDQYDQGCKLP